jgi:hypothetical protein
MPMHHTRLTPRLYRRYFRPSMGALESKEAVELIMLVH